MEQIFKPFKQGIHSTLYGAWDLKLITPLMIRHGSTAAWQSKPDSLKKGRNQEMQFSWTHAESNWSEVSDFNYAFSIIQNELTVQYEIPASSIRGALRQWTIKNLIERQNWNVFDVPTKEELTDTNLPRYIERAQANLKDKTKRWCDVLSLFGCVYDLDPKISDPLAWAGRLQVITSTPRTSNAALHLQGQWSTSATIDGPDNINRHITVRNPLDRVSAAAKEGGLHQFIEMSEGETFGVEFHIINPSATDLEIIQLWVEDINAGFLRFGALASQGRGRVQIENQQYKLYLSPKSPLSSFLKKQKIDLAKDTLFEGIWRGYQLTFDELMKLRSAHNLDLKKRSNTNEP